MHAAGSFPNQVAKDRGAPVKMPVFGCFCVDITVASIALQALPRAVALLGCGLGMSLLVVVGLLTHFTVHGKWKSVQGQWLQVSSFVWRVAATYCVVQGLLARAST